MNQEPEKINYNAFADDDRDYSNEQNNNVKLSNKKSRFASAAKPPTEEQFNSDVKKYKQKDLDQRNLIAELTGKYKSVIFDKTVEDNKSPIQKELELSIIQELVQLGLKLNNDHEQPEGIGSIGLCNLLLQTNIIQRDIINKLGYEVSKLNRTVAQLKQKVDVEND